MVKVIECDGDFDCVHVAIWWHLMVSPNVSNGRKKQQRDEIVVGWRVKCYSYGGDWKLSLAIVCARRVIFDVSEEM